MKKLCALLLTAAMVLSMTACGGKPQESSQNQKDQGQAEAVQTEGSSTGQETEPAQEAQGESGQKEDIVLSYWAQWSENETQAQVLKAAIARFEENNPGCKVEVNWAGRDVRDILRSSIDSGNKIDIVEGDFSKITGNLGEDYLMDLTPYMEGTEFESSITEGMASFAKSYTSDGKSWYYIPSQPFVGTLFYNKAIFAEAGIDKMPATWDEFLDCCQKIKDAGYDPITVDDAYQQSMYGHYLAMIKDVDWVGELLTDKTGKLWDDPAILQMAEDFQELREKGYFAKSVGSNVFPAAQNGEFAMGTAAMYYNGSWLPNEVAEITGDDFQWGAMFFPAPEGSKYPYTTYTTGCQFYGVNKDCEHPEEAVALLAEFTSVKTQQALVDEAQCIPVINGITLPDNLVCVGELMEESTDAFVWGGSNLEDADVRAIINASFTKLLAGDIDAPKFVEEIKSQLK